MTIGEFSVITGISAYTLRYYEKKGLLRVSRDSVGRRDYSVDDIEWVKFIVFCQALFPKKSVRIPFFQQGNFPAFGGH